MVYNNRVDSLKEKLKHLPDEPGVYVMLDASGMVIYVGKAKNLKNRVRQYFFSNLKSDKTEAMVSHIADFYYIIAPTEIDALSLENNLIKKHKPRYNILLKDDKTYPYIKVDFSCDYPSFSITRKIKKDKAKYFGPFMAGVNAKEVLEMLNLAYKIRPCNKNLCASKPVKECLNFHIGKCLSPCSNRVSVEEYRERVNKAIDFLMGNEKGVENLYREKMLLCAENEEFELAKKYRDCLNSIEKIKQKRINSISKDISADVISIKNNGVYCAISMLFVRNGRMLGAKNFSFESGIGSDAQTLSEFILRYYVKGVDVPEEIIVDNLLEDQALLSEYLKKETGTSVAFHFAKVGIKHGLIKMAEANATEHLEVAVSKIEHKNDMTVKACERLKDILGLKKYPKRMECYDISNISGQDKVGSMVVFTDGEPDRTEYRRFKIKSFEGADDFRAHQEMMERRILRLKSGDEKFLHPDLLVIDGGKGQLSSVKEILDKHDVDVDVIALAERNEEIFTVNSSSPIVLSKSDYSLRLLQRIRDEAHRFAVTFHRSLRSKRALSSVLDGVQGLGKVKRKALIERFKDIGNIISASETELMQVDGIGKSLAEQIIQTLKREGLK